MRGWCRMWRYSRRELAARRVCGRGAVGVVFFLVGGLAAAQTLPPGVLSQQPGAAFEFDREALNGFNLQTEPVLGQPFSLLETKTTVRLLADGTKMTNLEMTRRVRDGQGRERTESGHVKDGSLYVNEVEIRDPVALRKITLITNMKSGQVRTMRAPKPPKPDNPERDAALARMDAEREARRAARPGAPVTETLAARNIAGLTAEGKRTTWVIPSGLQGNDKEIRVVLETWTSPDLKIVVEKTLDDPRVGKSTMTLSEFSRADPAASLFEVPADYHVMVAAADGNPVN